MKKLLHATTMLFALGAGGSALAADMAVKAPNAVMRAPAYSWTGFYIGGNGGYGWNDSTVSFTPNDPVSQLVTCGGLFGGTCPPSASFNIQGALGGLQAGYNYQINQNWLFGVETDFDWSNIKGTGTSNFFITVSPSTFQASDNVKWFGTVRARVGYLPTSNVLLFATGGFAYARVDENDAVSSPTGTTSDGTHSFICSAAGGAGATNCFIGNSSRTATGFALGGGGEYALSNHVSLKAEYLYVNLGHGNSVNVAAQAVAPGTMPSSFTAAYGRLDFNVVRGGVNFKF